MFNKKDNKTGSTTLEYAILLPVVFACIFVAIIVMMILYQRTLIQSIAEDAAQSLSRQWGYKPLPVRELKSGVYKRETYDTREIYWNIKLWNNGKKAESAEKAINEIIDNAGLLKKYPKEHTSNQSGSGPNPESPSTVTYKPGLPSTLTVDIKVGYFIPGAGLMKLLGMGDCLIIEGHGKALVYDAKDMINTTDYAIQLISKTAAYQQFITKIAPLKENMEKLLGE